MKTRTLSKSEIKILNQDLFQEYGIEPLSKKELILSVEGNSDEINYLKIDGIPSFFYHEETLLPTLRMLHKENFLKKITVDMGAVKFVASGADVMRPGIKDIDAGIHQNEIVSIIDINNKKVLAIGKALFSSEEMNNLKEGKCIQNIHYVGDDVWKLT